VLPPARWPAAARTLARTWGARGAALRAVHEARRAAGRFRAAPRFALASAAVPGEHPFRVDAARLGAATERDAALERAGRVAGGEHQAYRWEWRPLPGDAGAWLRNPLTGHAYPSAAPWWTVPHLDPRAGDIKDAWEPGRFGWAYDLVRGWLVTGDHRYADAFARTFAAWRESSPPFTGPHWACGQETAIRAAALLYAEANLPRVEGVAETLAASGERIADAIGYAVSQRNNHALSEAAGLIALGVRFRGLHPEADGWLARGRRWLERLIPEQFAADGWYVQHSFTYLRLALDACLIAERALRSIGQRLPPESVARLRAAAELLLAVMEPETGTVPNHGANDGAFVHPITTAGYRDFRPAVTAACAAWGAALPADVRPDAEALAWLGVRTPQAGPPLGDGVRSGASGWAVAKVGDARVFLRAGRYATRPGHLDPLQLDVRFGAREVVVDPGTYAYNAPPPWRNGLVSALVHNGPVLDGREPGVRGPRFVWYLWPEADLLRADFDGRFATLVAEVRGKVRRTVVVTREEVRVEDRILPGVADEAAVRWLLHPDASAESVRVEGGGEVMAAREGATPGWYSPAYGARTASRWVEARRGARDGAEIVTTIRAG
jgi:heparinase II/III-like protein